MSISTSKINSRTATVLDLLGEGKYRLAARIWTELLARPLFDSNLNKASVLKNLKRAASSRFGPVVAEKHVNQMMVYVQPRYRTF